MKSFNITTMSGTLTYQAASQADALRQHTARFPGEAVLSVAETSTYQSHAGVLASSEAE